ncbi:MAG: hypothetical protein ABMA64_36125, partial [Myxococcota bacterium]
MEGWTADGRYFAFSVQRYDDESEEPRPGGGVIDTRLDSLRVLDAQPYEAWKAEHPLQAGSKAATCGGAEVVSQSEELTGLEVAMPGDSEGSLHWTTVSVRAKGKTWLVHESDGAVPDHSWSPTCGHVAWAFPGFRLRDQRTDGILPLQRIGAVAVRPAGPVVHVMVHKDAQDITNPLMEHLSAKGWGPHLGADAVKDRDLTVVYATDEALDVAAKLHHRALTSSSRRNRSGAPRTSTGLRSACPTPRR